MIFTEAVWDPIDEICVLSKDDLISESSKLYVHSNLIMQVQQQWLFGFSQRKWSSDLNVQDIRPEDQEDLGDWSCHCSKLWKKQWKDT